MTATPIEKTTCFKCQRPKNTLTCGGCAQDFCFNHMVEHRNELNEQLVTLEEQLNEFKVAIEEQKTEPQKHDFMKQIDDWERESIVKIQQKANEVRREFASCIINVIIDLDFKLKQLNDKLMECRREEDFIDTDIEFFNAELEKLKNNLRNPPGFTIEHDTTPLISLIRFSNKTRFQRPVTLNLTSKWIRNGVTIAGGYGFGDGINQLYYPQGLCFESDQTFYIAEYSNHRIVKWRYGATAGRVVAGGHGQGNLLDHLNGPTDVIIDKERDSIIICDYGNKRVVRWPRQNGTQGEVLISNIGCNGLVMDDEGFLYVVNYDQHEVRKYRIGETEGVLVAGGNGQGSRLDKLNHPRFVFVDREHSVYVSDESNHRVVKWTVGAKQGIVVAGGHGQGSSANQLSYPNGIFVDPFGTVYVVDGGNDRVMSWSQGATEGKLLVGGNGQGNQSSQLSFPIGLSFDDESNLCVSDYRNHRVQKFNIDRNR